MSKWVIDKQIDFCYGHRVWSQQLEKEFCTTGDYCTKCRHLHGHQGEIHVFLEAPQLERGMVTDFKHLGWLKDFIDDHVDHKFILDMNDPWFEHILNGKFVTNSAYPDSKVLQIPSTEDGLVRCIKPIPILIPETDHWMGYALDVSDLEGPEQEFFEGFVLVDFLPTSENITKWIFEAAEVKMARLGVKVTRVTLNETPKSRADYSRSV